MTDDLKVKPSWGTRLVGIEGLRGIAALLVLAHHTTLRMADPDALGPGREIAELMRHGLTLFFVLSGFLLYRPFVTSILEGRALPSVKRYAINRVLRIYPAYVVILLLVSLVFGAAYVYGSPDVSPTNNLGYLTDRATLGADLLLIQTYIPSLISTGIGPAWSLTAEFAFYIVLPALAWIGLKAAAKAPRAVAAFVAPAVLIVVGLGTTVVLTFQTRGMTGDEAAQFNWGDHASAVLARSLLAQADLFGYGMVVAAIFAILRNRGLSSVQVRTTPLLLLAAVAVAAVGARGPVHSLQTSIMAVAASLVVASVALPGARRRSEDPFGTALEWRPLRYLGLISYSVYLWHNPILWWLQDRGWTFGNSAAAAVPNVLLVFVVTVAFATVTYSLVERPAMNRKRSTQAVPARAS